MGTLGDYVEVHALDTIFGASAWPTIATHYIALYTAVPSDASATGTEVSGGSYARVAVTNNSTTWPAASGTNPATKANGITITFPAPTANWGTVLAMAVYDASTSGNELAWAALNQSKTISNGDAAPSFPVASLVITLD